MENVKHVVVLNPSAGGGGGGGTVNQGEPNTCDKAWPVKFTAVDESVVCIDAGDAANNALRVNIVAGFITDINIDKYGGTATTLGTKVAASSIPVTLASDQSLIKKGTLSDFSGSITLGGTSQDQIPANASRNYVFVSNISTDILWINFGVAAVQDQPSIKLVPGASFVMESSFISTQKVTIIGPNTGAKFVAKEGV